MKYGTLKIRATWRGKKEEYPPLAITKFGLLTAKTQEKYEEMNILQFQDLEDDKVIDWDEMSKPLEYSSKTA